MGRGHQRYATRYFLVILGPILFIIYINDLPEICEQFARIYLFGDGAKLFKHVICDEDHKALQLGLNALQDWSNKWLLQLNILKCKTVFFGRNININYTYSLHGTQLERLDHMKNLGVIFDTDLNFVQHSKKKRLGLILLIHIQELLREISYIQTKMLLLCFIRVW